MLCESLILQEEKKRKRCKSKRNIRKQSQDRSRKFIDRDAIVVGLQKRTKNYKRKEEDKKMERERKRSIVFCPFLSRNCYELATSNTTRSPITTHRLTDFFPRTYQISFNGYHASLAATWHSNYFGYLIWENWPSPPTKSFKVLPHCTVHVNALKKHIYTCSTWLKKDLWMNLYIFYQSL